MVAGSPGACEDDASSARASGIRISTAKTARTLSTFLLRLVVEETSAGKKVFAGEPGTGTSSNLVAGWGGGATGMAAAAVRRW